MLTASQMLAVWEQGTGQLPMQRALLLLAAACPEDSPGDLACLSIGARDARLLSLREITFGPKLASITACPACAEQLEMNFQTGDLRAAPPEPGAQGWRFTQADYQVAYRLPNSLDLVSAAAVENGPDRRRVLIERCLLTMTHREQPVGLDDLPAGVIDGVVKAMQAADPMAEINLNMTCPACGNAWLAPFDILAYFWSEIDAWAYRTLQEVHRLAQAYGWTEAEILSLSARRRQLYLAMV